MNDRTSAAREEAPGTVQRGSATTQAKPPGERPEQGRSAVPVARREGGPELRPVSARPVKVFSGTGIYTSVIIGFLLAAALVILVGQNTHRVTVNWLPWSITVPLGAVLLAAVLAGSFVTILVGLAWRRNARRILSEREELKRLRAADKPSLRPDIGEPAAQRDTSAQMAAQGGSSERLTGPR